MMSRRGSGHFPYPANPAFQSSTRSSSAKMPCRAMSWYCSTVRRTSDSAGAGGKEYSGSGSRRPDRRWTYPALLAKSCSEQCTPAARPVVGGVVQQRRTTPRHVHVPRLPHDRHFDFAWIRQLLLECFDDAVANLGGRFVGRFFCIDEHAQLAARLNGMGLIDAGKTARDPFEALPSA